MRSDIASFIIAMLLCLGLGSLVLPAMAQDIPTMTPPPPPSPLIEIQSVALDEARNSFRVEFLLTNQQLIWDLDVKVEGARAGVLAYQNQYRVQNSIEIPTGTLTRGEEYLLTVTALDSSGQPIAGLVPGSFSSAQQRTIQDQRRFVYPMLAPPEIEIISVDLTQDNGTNTYLITLRQNNAESVRAYSIWLENETTGLRAMPEQVFRSPLTNPLPLPLTDVPGGRYRVIVNALDDGNNIVASHSRQGMTYDVRVPGFFARVGGNSLLVAFIAFVVAVLLFVILYVTVFKPKVAEYEFGGGGSFRGHTSKFIGDDAERTAMRLEKKRRDEMRRLARQRQGYAQLEIVYGGNLNGQKVEVTGYPFVIGRESANLTIPDKKISGQHGSIHHENGTYYFQDHQSTNGTYVNSVRIGSMKHPLNDGDMIGLGTDVQIRFSIIKPSG